MKDAKSGTISTTVRFSDLGVNVCALRVTLADNNGNLSDDVFLPLEFK
jgi:hypothetical protein